MNPEILKLNVGACVRVCLCLSVCLLVKANSVFVNDCVIVGI